MWRVENDESVGADAYPRNFWHNTGLFTALKSSKGWLKVYPDGLWSWLGATPCEQLQTQTG
eukprot:5594232-Amphidinium_carterae.3